VRFKRARMSRRLLSTLAASAPYLVRFKRKKKELLRLLCLVIYREVYRGSSTCDSYGHAHDMVPLLDL